jgi:hypothetical protein
MKLLLALAFIIFIVVIGPLATLWALNTLFNLNIAYTFNTWLAAAIINGLFSQTVRVKK